MANRQGRLSGGKWAGIRSKVLKRDHGLCQSCKSRGLIRFAQEVDHIIRLSDGGSNNPDNLQSLCTACHTAKTNAENGCRRVGCDHNGYPITDVQPWGRGVKNSSGR
jgi:5-methylcytosine-specific restriction protein A